MADKQSWIERKSRQKQALLNSQAALNSAQSAQKLMVQMFSTSQELKVRFDETERQAVALDWRLSALIELALEKFGLDKDGFNALVRKQQIDAFDIQSDLDDRQRGLVPTDETAQEGMHAIFNLKLYRDGEELRAQELVRSKVLLGQDDVLEEVDFVLLNLNVGETASVDFFMQGQPVTASITLLGLRKQLPKAPPAPVEEPTSPVAPEAQAPTEPQPETTPAPVAADTETAPSN